MQIIITNSDNGVVMTYYGAVGEHCGTVKD
jgi:hypothetical protein